MFVSLHCNAATSKEANGVEVCCSGSKASHDLAQTVLASIAPLFKVNRGVKERPGLLVLKHTDAPAILIEMGFLSCEREAVMLGTREFRQSLALAIAKGINTHIGRLSR